MNKQQIIDSLDEFTTAYIEAMLWSSCDDEGDPLDDSYNVSDLTKESLAKCKADCKTFQERYSIHLRSTEAEPAQNGFDFWLTRCGHGSGFWDRGYKGDVGERLTAYATTFGNIDPYIYRGKVHLC